MASDAGEVYVWCLEFGERFAKSSRVWKFDGNGTKRWWMLEDILGMKKH
jgi:hypothetical protein